MNFFIVSSFLFAGDAFAEQYCVGINFKACCCFDIFLHMVGNSVVKMINLATARTFHMKMTVALFIADILINKTPAVAFYCSVNKAVLNKLLHKSVSCALADSVFREACYDLVDGKSIFTVGLQKIYKNFSLMGVINLHNY